MKIAKLLVLLLTTSGIASAHGMSEADQARAAEGGFMDFFPLGATHMITGYDHLLFLFGVVFFLTKFKDILKFVTAFTVGHSITLIGATFMGIQANYFLVDAVIALTVCYKGFDNIGGFKKYFDMKSPNLVAAVFIFGLIHGFGLSTRLQQVTIGEGMDLLGKIIAFNIGVEAGQIAALVVILGALSLWRHTASFTRFANASNALLIIVGGLLFVMQIHGYQHDIEPSAFRFDEDSHSHAHEDASGAHAHEDGVVHVHGDEDHDESIPHVHDDEADRDHAEEHAHDDEVVHVHGDEEHDESIEHVHDDAADHDHAEEHSHDDEVVHVHGDEDHDESIEHVHDDEAEHVDEVVHVHGDEVHDEALPHVHDDEAKDEFGLPTETHTHDDDDHDH
jgi:hypothetical protein